MVKYSEQAKQNASQLDMIIVTILNSLYDLYIATVFCIWLYSFTTDTSIFVSIFIGPILVVLAILPGYSHFITTLLIFFAFISGIPYEVIFSSFLSMWLFFSLFIPNITGILLMVFETDDMSKERIDMRPDY